MTALLDLVGDTPELDLALDRILQVVCNLLGADDGSIGLTELDGTAIRIRATHCMPSSERGSVFRKGEGLAGAVLASRAPVRLDRYSEIPGALSQGLDDNAVLGVPALWHGELVGFFGLGRRPPRTFDEDDERLLLRFSQYAAIVIHESRTRAESKRSLEDLDRLSRLGQDLSAATTIEETTRSFLHHIASHGGFVCSVALHEALQPRRVTVIGQWHPETGATLVRIQYPDSPGSLDVDLDKGRAVTIENVFTDPRCGPELRSIQKASGRPALALFPLMAESRRIGTVALSDSEPKLWTPEELGPYSTAISMLGSALAARLAQEQRTVDVQRLARYEVRHRLARELHDSVCQSIFAMSLVAQSLEPTPGLERVVQLSREALADMRHLIRELQPPPDPTHDDWLGFANLRTEGFATALRRHIDVLQAASNPVELSVSPNLQLHPDQVWPLLCATLEAIGNGVRHSGATIIRVAADTVDRTTRVTVTDDGCGFEPLRSGPGLGLGLSSMKERMETVGGRMTLQTSPGRGTTVCFEVPLA
ncbi:MAG: GAF domain-containing sensor histidine kinase [Fimbriimonadaceae bacterium]|nr:GAF domain-containing sensor histidine kinase [Fimbriimonadaceae bacterium]QYK57423.1 MAG: GAF domain-containing sensor histidine kinase [Fimbriimonadaceae bacterium]